MGFGHRVYRVEDPRAKHLKRLALELGQQVGDTSKVQILDTVVRVVGAEKHIFPNVDLYSGAAYAAMGISTDQFTPIFAMSRIAGWTAHVLEQHGNNRLIRPRSDYTGAHRPQVRPARRAVAGGPRPSPRRGPSGAVARAVDHQRGPGRLQPARPHPRLPREPAVAPPAPSSCAWSTTPPPTAPRRSSASGRAGPPLRYHRNADNVGLIRALNQGAGLAGGDRLCFLHNDTVMREPRWLERLEAAVDGPGRVGLAGLYGVRRLRRDGRYVGRTIVHALEGQPTLRARR